MDNTVCLVGNLTREPELKYLPSGAAVVNLGLAVNRYMGPDKDAEVSFFDVVVWQEMAENCGATLEQGSRVIVAGRLKQETWEQEDGTKRSAVKVIADEIGPSLRWAEARVIRNEKKGQQQSRPSAVVTEEAF